MKNLEKLYGRIKTEEELVEKIGHQKSIWMYKDKKGIEEFLKDFGGIFIVRAINSGELKELIQKGPNEFLFHKGANFCYGYEFHIQQYAPLRSGTIIISEIKTKDIDIQNNGSDLSKETKKKVGGSLRGICLRDFISFVEVYNILGHSWEKLKTGIYPDLDAWL